MSAKQQIIDKINDDFKGKALKDGCSSSCAYLNNSDQRCVVGLFIGDIGRVKNSDESADDVLYENSDILLDMPSHSIKFWQAAQEQHDELNIDDELDFQKGVLTQWVESNFDLFEHTEKEG